MFGKLALTALLGLFPLTGNAQFAGSGFPVGGGFPGMFPNSFQNSAPMGNPSNGFPAQVSPFGQPFMGNPQGLAGQRPFGQPAMNGQWPMGLPSTQPIPYWMQNLPTGVFPPPPLPVPLPAARPSPAPSPPSTYFQYAPTPSPTGQPPRWAPLNGALPRTNGNWTGNSWSNSSTPQYPAAPATPPRWPTP